MRCVVSLNTTLLLFLTSFFARPQQLVWIRNTRFSYVAQRFLMCHIFFCMCVCVRRSLGYFWADIFQTSMEALSGKNCRFCSVWKAAALGSDAGYLANAASFETFGSKFCLKNRAAKSKVWWHVCMCAHVYWQRTCVQKQKLASSGLSIWRTVFK